MVTSQKLFNDLKRGKLYPIYLLLGQEREEKRELIELINKKLKERGGNIEKFTFYGDELEISEVLNELQTYSFFNETKLIIIKNVEMFSISKAFLSYIQDPNSKSILVLLTDKNDISKNLQRAVETKGRVAKFWKNFQDKVEKWIISELKSRNIRANMEVTKYIIEVTGNQKEDILNQINAISNYLENGETLDIDKLKEIVSRIVQYNIFDLINSLFLKDPVEIIKIFRSLIENGDDLIRINYFFWSYLKTLIIASSYKDMGYSDSQIISILKLRKLEAGRIKRVISNISRQFLNELMLRLENIDYSAKTRPRFVSILQFEKLLMSLKMV